MARVVDFRHGPNARRDVLDGHDRQDRAHVGAVGGVLGEDQGGRRIAQAGALEILLIRRVATDEVDALPGGVLVEVRDHDDLELVVVAAQLGDQVPGRRVPAAHHDVVLVPRSTQALTLLEQKIDDHRDKGARDHPEHGDPEQDQQPADDAPTGRGDEGGVALTQHRRDPPVERIEDRLERPRLLDQRDEDRRDEDEPDDALGEREEEAAVELTGYAPDVPGHAADDRRDEREGQGRTMHRRPMMPEPAHRLRPIWPIRDDDRRRRR